MMELLQPYLETILNGLLGLLTVLIMTILMLVKGKVERWLDSRTNEEQRKVIHRMGLEAFAYAETLWNDADSQQKLEAAKAYLIKQLREIGIEIDAAEIRAVIERAVLDYNARVK